MLNRLMEVVEAFVIFIINRQQRLPEEMKIFINLPTICVEIEVVSDTYCEDSAFPMKETFSNVLRLVITSV